MASTPRPRPRSDGSVAWQVPFYYRDTCGKRRQSSETFDEYAEAQWWAALIDKVGIEEALKVLEATRDSGSDVILLTTWLHRYVDRMTGVQEDGRRKYRAFIRNDIVPFFGEGAPIDAVTQDTDAAWVVYLEQDRGNSPKTIANKHGFLSAALRAAVEQRPTPLLPYNPCAGTRLPRHDPAEIDIFSNDEWELFEQLLLERWRPQAEFGLVSMARPSEVGALLVRDIDPETGAVRINKAWKDDGTRLRLGKPKSKRGIRTVNVPLETVARLDLARPGDALLFHTRNDTPVTAYHFYKNAWQPALRRLEALSRRDFSLFTKKALWRGEDPELLLAYYGSTVNTLCGKRLSPYTLRHTGISWKLQDGVPLFVVSRDAGHESVTTTDRRYGHNDRAASASAAQVIAGRLPRVRASMLTLAA
ncbi:tyrosine-type recombinase/integrase [Nocardia abscessus]|uniref:tyrosine-type recombinase/integrase n=1 Tax=Nocardia abscessus TaxID=120957 RepID=UPI000311EFB7|nr:site-specific integrase [Nocardia abscessus]MCC3328217.1 tyrosine-type recombinase/integrase [Nocardia abscessus]